MLVSIFISREKCMFHVSKKAVRSEQYEQYNSIKGDFLNREFFIVCR